MKKKLTLSLAAVLLIAAMVLTACGTKNAALSSVITGQWHGQLDVAALVYQELGKELGIELNPEPVYCDVTMEFRDDGTCSFMVDTESFVEAVGKCAEPYVSGFFGTNTEWLIDMIMQYAAQNMPVDTGREDGTYEVDDEANSVTIYGDNGGGGTLTRDDDGNLIMEDAGIGQTIVLSK